MLQDKATVRQVVGGGFQSVTGDVMAACLYGVRETLEAGDVDVGRHHRSRGGDALAEPPCDRSTTRPYFEATPPVAESCRGEMTNGELVGCCFKVLVTGSVRDLHRRGS
jgi:hypothetical protein